MILYEMKVDVTPIVKSLEGVEKDLTWIGIMTGNAINKNKGKNIITL